jgi:peptidase S41-like protein
MTPETPTARTLASDLGVWIDRLFPDAGRGARLKRALEERFGGDARAVTNDVCREVEAVAHDFSRHFALEYFADGSLVPDTEPPGWPPQEAREVPLRAGSVREVTRHPDGAGVLARDGHDGVHISAPYLEAAFAQLRGARGVVLDLRRNQGGDLGTVMLVLDRLLGGEPTHICDVIYRERTRQWWTTGRLADLAPPQEMPVSVLVSEHTFSSGEGLAYHLQSHERAKLVGQRTRGAADHITPVRLTRHVRALLPEARVRDAVTGTNWEGTGVVPDIPCEPVDAPKAAIDALTPR